MGKCVALGLVLWQPSDSAAEKKGIACREQDLYIVERTTEIQLKEFMKKRGHKAKGHIKGDMWGKQSPKESTRSTF